jgi:hypothetical protein
MTRDFVVYVLSNDPPNAWAFRYATVDEADTAARKARGIFSDRSKYLITVCHEDCGLLGTF